MLTHRGGAAAAAAAAALTSRRSLFGLFQSDPVLAAVKDGDNEALREALVVLSSDDGNGKGPSALPLNKPDMLGFRPIDYAVADGSHVGAEAVELLVAAGASVEAAEGKDSVLIPVCEHTGDEGARMAEALLSGGADIDHMGKSGVTPLHRALSKGNVGVVTVLLSHGADVDKRNVHGVNAVEWADALGQRFEDLDLGEMIENARKERWARDPELAARMKALDAAAKKVGYVKMDAKDKKPLG